MYELAEIILGVLMEFRNTREVRIRESRHSISEFLVFYLPESRDDNDGKKSLFDLLGLTKQV